MRTRIDKDMEAMITAEKQKQVQIENQIATLANANLALSPNRRCCRN